MYLNSLHTNLPYFSRKEVSTDCWRTINSQFLNIYANNKEGEENGIKIGEANGIKIGEANGIKIGVVNGIKIGQTNVARNLLKLNMPIDLLIQTTGLSKEEVESLKSKENRE